MKAYQDDLKINRKGGAYNMTTYQAKQRKVFVSFLLSFLFLFVSSTSVTFAQETKENVTCNNTHFQFDVTEHAESKAGAESVVMTVTNISEHMAKNVKLKFTLPDFFQAGNPKEISKELDALKPNEQKSFRITRMATELPKTGEGKIVLLVLAGSLFILVSGCFFYTHRKIAKRVFFLFLFIGGSFGALSAHALDLQYHHHRDELQAQVTVLGKTAYKFDVNAEADFEEEVHQIIFDANGGGEDGGTSPTEYIYSPSRITTVTLTQPTPPIGYAFDAWAISGGTTTLEDNELTVKAGSEGDIDVKATWVPITYDLTYVLNGGTWAEDYTPPTNYDIETENFILPTAEEITREGYDFAGWYDAENGGEQVTEIPKESIGDKTFYARWTPITYGITFELNEGAWQNDYTPPADYTIETETFNLPTASNMTRTGYTFDGWFTEDTFANQVTNITKGSMGDKIFYAKWRINAYTYTFNKNNTDAGSPEPNPATITKDYDVELGTLPTVTRTGYTFKEWNTQANGLGTKIETTTKVSAANTTVYAIWETDDYAISWYDNGGTYVVSTLPTSYTIETATYTLPTGSDITRTGYTFSGWYDNAELTGSAITQIAKGSTGNKDLYAMWTANQTTVTLNGNGQTTAGQDIVTETYDAALITLINQPVKTGYTLSGWYTATTGGTKVLNANGSVAATAVTDYITDSKWSNTSSTLTLYAQWTADEYSISINANGGTGGSASPNKYAYNASGTSTIALTPPTSPGDQTFLAWTLNVGSDIATVSGNTLTVKAGAMVAITATATWEAKYRINYIMNDGSWVADYTAPSTYGPSNGVTLPTSSNITRDDYSFEGWYDNPTFTGSPITQIAQGSTNNKMFYAKWTAAVEVENPNPGNFFELGEDEWLILDEDMDDDPTNGLQALAMKAIDVAYMTWQGGRDTFFSADGSNGYEDARTTGGIGNAVDDWYQENIAGQEIETYILPVNLNNPDFATFVAGRQGYSGGPTNFNLNNASNYNVSPNRDIQFRTTLGDDVNPGVKQAFVLSQGDIWYHISGYKTRPMMNSFPNVSILDLSSYPGHIPYTGSGQTWLRSVYSSNSILNLSATGEQGLLNYVSGSYANQAFVRPCVAIQITPSN